jgi:hypothetical protein
MSAFRFVASMGMVLLLAHDSFAEESLGRQWQARIDAEPRFQFDEEEGNVLFSLREFAGDCQVHMIYDPTSPADWTFNFVRHGKVVLELKGHEFTIFRTNPNDPFREGKRSSEKILYFADYSPYSDGCLLVAYDLRTGKELWKAQLKGIGAVDHSVYSNRINMDLDESVVRVAGREAGGNYVEVVDRKTGRTIAHRLFPLPKQPSRKQK